MVEEKGEKLKMANEIILSQQDKTIEENREVLELLASEKVEQREREKEKLEDEFNKALEKVRKKNWENPKIIEVLEKLEN